MKRLLIALVLLGVVSELSEAQRIRVRRIVQTQADTAGAGDFLLGEPLFTTDTHRMYVGIHTGVVRLGLDSLGLLDLDSVYANTVSDGAPNMYIASDGRVYRTTDTTTYISTPFHILPPLYGVGQAANGTVGGNDSVLYCFRFDIREPFTVGKIAVMVATVSGSGSGYIGLGIYDTSGAKLTGGVLTANVNNNGMILDVTDYTLPAGSYYFVFGQLTTSTYAVNMQRYTVSLPFWTGTTTGNVTNVYPLSIATNRMTDAAMPATLGTLTYTTSFTMPYAMLIYSGATYN